LLDAAVKVFAAKGYHAARVDDIVRRARLSHGTFYLYFANKEDIFGVLTADVAEQMSALVHSLDPFEPGPDGVDALRKWLAEFAELYSHYGPVIRAWTEAEADGSEFGQLGNQMLGELAVAFARHVDASPAKKLDPDVASLALLAMIERFNYYGVSGQLRLDPERTIDALAIAVHDSLFGRSARSSRRET
jgi:AcrR family transcriptional regulator